MISVALRIGDFNRTLRAGLMMSMLAAVLAGCSRDYDKERRDQILVAIEDGRLRSDLQHFFDRNRECVRVLFTHLQTGLLIGPPDDPATRALLDSGLIVSADRPDEQNNRFYRPAPQAAKWFKREEGQRYPETHLCFAKREVTSLLASNNGARWDLRYQFRLTDPAPWVQSPVIRLAFPEISEAFNLIFVSDETVHLVEGQLDNRNIVLADGYYPYYAFGINFTSRSTRLEKARTDARAGQ